MLVMHLTLILIVDFADLTLGMLFLHAFTFDPAWVRPARGARPARMYYDGRCGLCHGAVRFLLAEDPYGRAFRFAPLQGATFAREVRLEERARVANSLILQEPGSGLSIRSEGVLRALAHLGGIWRVFAGLGRLLPRRVRDFAYDRVAAVRLRYFSPPGDLCPLLPARWHERFDD
jgi:predicted DCC family thiol-disulfide oxidoreductase YuxK